MVLKRLTAARAGAALAVFVFHLDHWDVLTLPLASILYVGVGFFFVLSGFVLAWSASAEVSTRTFYRRRFARVWPSHFATLLVSLVVPVVAVSRGRTEALLNLFLVQAWSRSSDVIYGMNGVSWSLSCEATFYALFPLTIWVFTRCDARTRLVLTAIGLGGAFLFMSYSPALASSLPFVRFPEFLVGVALAMAMRDGWRSRVPIWVASLVVLLGAVLAQHVAPPRPNLVLVLPFALLISSLAAADVAGSSGWLAHRWLVTAGEVSFAFYLVHEMVVINLRGELPLPAVAEGALIFLVAAASACALHWGIERPCNRWLRGSSRRLAAVTSA
jgi:peptidoglycan/LPS O-acetylase OafA/YrhL